LILLDINIVVPADQGSLLQKISRISKLCIEAYEASEMLRAIVPA